MARGGTPGTTQLAARQWHEIAARTREVEREHHAQMVKRLLRAVRNGSHGRQLAAELDVSTLYINRTLTEHAQRLPQLAAAKRRNLSYAKGECAEHGEGLWRREASGRWRCAACRSCAFSQAPRTGNCGARARRGSRRRPAPSSARPEATAARQPSMPAMRLRRLATCAAVPPSRPLVESCGRVAFSQRGQSAR